MGNFNVNKKQTLTVPRSIINQKDPVLLLTYLAVQSSTRHICGDRVGITPETISAFLYSNGKIHTDEHRDALKKLYKLNILSRLNMDLYYCPENTFTVPEGESFISIYTEDLIPVLDSSQHKIADLIYHYCYLLFTINYTNKVGFMSIEKFAKALNISRQTVIDREKSLSEFQLVSFKRSPNKSDRKRYYCRYNEQEYFKKFFMDDNDEEDVDQYETLDLDEFS